MTREIKFRAWDKDDGFMYHSDRDEDSGEGLIVWYLNANGLYFEKPMLIDRMMGSSHHHQEIDYRRPNQVIMQFTGLLDKNGLEIWEGDILEATGEGGDDIARYTVEYIAPSFIRRHTNPGDWDGIVHDGLNPYDIQSRGFFVIGNIYSNPELIED